MRRFYFLLLCLGLFSQCHEPTGDWIIIQENSIIPQPAKAAVKKGVNLDLSRGFKFQTKGADFQALIEVFQTNLWLLTDLDQSATVDHPITIELVVDKELPAETYQLFIHDKVTINGGSYEAIAMAMTSLLQLIGEDLSWPGIEMIDQPDSDYRALMLDLARAWHDIPTLEQMITLCSWYKIRYLHLHLTDDQSFTIPSDYFPELPTPNRHYTKEQIAHLNTYAQARGVTLVPEIDVPGHASPFIKAMPKRFGLADVNANSYTLNMGKEGVYTALDSLIEELAALFPASPYIHIGGDEVNPNGMAEDPTVQAYLAEKKLESIEDLYRHFIIRLHESVKKQGKQTLVWEGFGPEGTVEMPKDIIVMAWETSHYRPAALLEDGFTVINASFKPLYVVNNRRWPVQYIYEDWHKYKWENWDSNIDPSFQGMLVEPNEKVIGGSMLAWEQQQYKQLPSLRHRLAAMSERLWRNYKGNWSNFALRLVRTNEQLERLIHPFTVKTAGRLFPGADDSNFTEHLWFDSILQLQLPPTLSNIQIHYTLDGTPPTPADAIWDKDLALDKNTDFRAQAFLANGTAVGHTLIRDYRLHPISYQADSLFADLAPNSWERKKFSEELKIVLLQNGGGKTIRYTLDGSPPNLQSPTYAQPIQITQSTRLIAQLYGEEEQAIGEPLRESFTYVKQEASLTTAKPTTASNEEFEPGLARLVTDGMIERWDHWWEKKNGDNWIQVDLENPTKVKELKVYTFWDNYRYYQYTIELSLDGQKWSTVVDFSKNTSLAKPDGYVHQIPATETQYIRLNVLHNSANPVLHIVELAAF